MEKKDLKGVKGTQTSRRVTQESTGMLGQKMLGLGKTSLMHMVTTAILAYINVHSERLAKQKKIKQKQAQEPVREMKKVDVENERLMDYVLMPEGPCESFHAWWKKLDTAAPVRVHYPHERHGLAGKTSNRAKSNLQQVNQYNIHDTIHSNTLTSIVLLY